MYRYFISIVIIVLLAACTSASSTPSEQPAASASQTVFTTTTLFTTTIEVASTPTLSLELTDNVTTATEPIVSEPELAAVITQAVDDLATRISVPISQIQVAQAEFTTWPDGSLGCPQPDMMYTQALVDGYYIQLLANQTTYDYHGALNQEPIFCEKDKSGQ